MTTSTSPYSTPTAATSTPAAMTTSTAGTMPLSLPLLQSGTSMSVQVSPLVLVTILDHYLRREEGQERVIGTLLGVRSEDGRVVEIRSALAVPHQESTEQCALDVEYHRSAVALHGRTCKEVVVGWYATGRTIASQLRPIHEFYNKEVGAVQQSAVHLLVDPAMGHSTKTGASSSRSSMLQAYTSLPLGGLLPSADMDAEQAGDVSGLVFYPLPCDLKMQADEKAGLHWMNESTTAHANKPLALPNSALQLQQSLLRVQETLQQVHAYVQQVRSGEREADPAMGRFLMDTVMTVVPKVLDADAFEALFQGKLQDILMVVYLSNMTKAQLAVAERLHQRIGQ